MPSKFGPPSCFAGDYSCLLGCALADIIYNMYMESGPRAVCALHRLYLGRGADQ